MWVEGTVNNTYIRRSLHTASWERAQGLAQEIESADDPKAPPPVKEAPTTLQQAVDEYLADAKARELADSTLAKLETIFKKQFLSWAKAEGYTLLREIDLRAIQSFRTTWKDGGLAKKKKQERLTGFFWFCIRAGWITTTPTQNLKRITVHQKPTDYFPREEYARIVDATYRLDDGMERAYDIDKRGQRLRALVGLLRWSGLRIRDAVTLERTRLLPNDDLFLYQAKTGVPVYVPLPHDVAEDLRNVPPGPKPNPRYFFWSGNGDPKSAVADWQRSFRRLFEVANLEKPDGTTKRCFPHMFRDTFAVENLLAGIPIDQVSILLGHKSVKITEKHYAPFVKARQDQLTASVRQAWQAMEPEKPKPTKRTRQAP
ncbi:tyrosine-type recombinase/integrase [Edaphobacter flagellatus]|uniref:tyrosine-type recombinase/integrase n=1 Tax=Edaphobacter flagellatus TaxID=1933044 RepID=UPI0021B26FFD|nr:tyrosine-type recombinase/integrase [Edaphobacter flagellatus]